MAPPALGAGDFGVAPPIAPVIAPVIAPLVMHSPLALTSLAFVGIGIGAWARVRRRVGPAAAHGGDLGGRH